MKVSTRTVFGKKLKNKRKQGILPAVIYDKDTNLSVELPVSEFNKEYSDKGHTGLVKVDLEGTNHNVLIDDVHINPITRQPIHVTLRQVNLKEEINAEVPIEYINVEECKGVKEDGGALVTNINEVEVIALPTNIPSSIEVNVANLGLGDVVRLQDIKLPDGVTFATEDENILSQVAVTVTHVAVEEIPTTPLETVVAESTEEKKKEEVPAEETTEK